MSRRHDHNDRLRHDHAEAMDEADATLDRFTRLNNTTGVQYVPLPPAQPPNILRDYQVIPMTKLAPQSVRCTPQGSPRQTWWTITANGNEVARNIANPGDDPIPADLLRWTEIQSRNGGVRSTEVQLQLSWDADEAVIDIGAGVQVSVLAPIVTCSLLVPSSVAAPNINQNERNQGVRIPPGGSQVLEAVISVGMSNSLSPLGFKTATCTRRYLGADTDVPELGGGRTVTPPAGMFQIPPRARWGTFYVPSGQDLPAANIGVQFFRSPFGDTPLGIVDLWDRRVSPRVRIPQGASVIRLTGFENTDQLTAVWELDL